MSTRAARNPLPPQLAALLREFWWLALLGVALYLALVLYTYDRADPGWSHGADVSTVHNAGGRVGAWLADIMLYLFGLSAYWWVVFCAFLVWWGFHRIEHAPQLDRRPYAIAVVGFMIVLLSSSGLEASRLHTLKAVLPHEPGGILGAVIGGGLTQALGFTGGTPG